MNLPIVEVFDNYVTSGTISSIPYGHIRYINAQLSRVKTHYSDNTFGQGSLYLLYDSITCLAIWCFFPHSIRYNNQGYGLAVNDPSILNIYQNTDDENLQQLQYSFNHFLKSIVIYSSEKELLYIWQAEINFYYRQPKYYNFFAETLEDAQKIALTCLSKEIDQYKINYSYSKKNISIAYAASELYEENFFIEKKIYLKHMYRNPFGEDIVAKISLIKRFPNEWRLLVESSHDRYMTVFLDEEFSVIDAKKGMFMK